MSAGGYEAFFQSGAFGPGWMHNTWGQAFWRSIGKVLDQQNDLLRNAQSVRNPDGAVALEMSDALDMKGDDLMLPRGGTAPDLSDETDAAMAARLKSPFTTWGQDPDTGGGAGSVLGILKQLKVAGFPIEPTPPDYWTTGGFLINHIGRIYDLVNDELNVVGDASPCINRQDLNGDVSGVLPGWTLDARDQFYSRWMLLFAEDVPELVNTTCEAKTRLNAICRRWKSGSAIYSGCAIVPQEDDAICWGWPNASTDWGQADLLWGTNGSRFIDPE
jgi:hypothetical protein